VATWLLLQVWVSLLRYTQPEMKRGLLREALDLMVDNLVAACAAEAGDKESASTRKQHWTTFVRRALLEEAPANHNLIPPLQLLVRHPDVFYYRRQQFMQQMVTALPRLGLPQQASMEYRRLAIDLASLLVSWEERRQQELAGMEATSREQGVC
jgi:transformation/transcription domain-associated protein